MGFPNDLGIIDLGVGFPYTNLEEKKAAYQFMRPLYKDQGNHRFDGVPRRVHVQERARIWSTPTPTRSSGRSEMDKWNVQIAKTGVSEKGIEAKKRYPDRFVLGMELRDTNDVMGSVRAIHEAKAEARHRQRRLLSLAVSIRRFRSTIRRCIRSTPRAWRGICRSSSTPASSGPRMPSYPQHVEHLDQVCYDFPELTIVTRHGTEPWEKLAMKLMLKWPGLHYCTSAFAPKHYPKRS